MGTASRQAECASAPSLVLYVAVRAWVSQIRGRSGQLRIRFALDASMRPSARSHQRLESLRRIARRETIPPRPPSILASSELVLTLTTPLPSLSPPLPPSFSNFPFFPYEFLQTSSATPHQVLSSFLILSLYIHSLATASHFFFLFFSPPTSSPPSSTNEPTHSLGRHIRRSTWPSPSLDRRPLIENDLLLAICDMSMCRWT